MDIAILTFHRACNYGAFLQAYALQENLNNIAGVQAFIFDYACEKIDNSFKPAHFFNTSNNKIKGLLKTVLNYQSRTRGNKTFEKARDRYFDIREKDLDKKGLIEISREYDAFIVGSDQVWNSDLNGNDKTFFLDFVKKPGKKFSYAASMGTIPDDPSKIRELCSYLKDFKAVSVRESELVDCLKNEIPSVTQCIDPVFLFSGDQWRKFSENNEPKGYVLFFVVGNGKNVAPAYEFAKSLAKRNNLRILYLSSREQWFKFRDAEHPGIVPPEQFVGLIDNADYVVTDSFHGTSLSILLHKQFYVETNKAKNSRILNILKMSGLENRALVSGKRTSETEETIDYQLVDRNLEPFIQHSKDYLNQIVDLCRVQN